MACLLQLLLVSDTNSSTGLDSDQLEFGPDNEEEGEAPKVYNEPTIEEDSNEEGEGEGRGNRSSSLLSSPRMSYKRFSNQSDKRISITSLRISESKGTASNRSSATIKPSHVNGNKALDDVSFENALRKFATERESFLVDLNLSAGVVQRQSKPRPRTQKIVSEEQSQLKSSLGSVRRRISFRELSSVKRQTSVARQGQNVH